MERPQRAVELLRLLLLLVLRMVWFGLVVPGTRQRSTSPEASVA